VAGGVHGDMTGYLNTAERTLMEQQDHEDRKQHSVDVTGTNDKMNPENLPCETDEDDPSSVVFRAKVTLCFYRYLVAMERTKGIFSDRKCNEIRKILHHTLRPNLSADRALAWLHLAQQKHKELLR
jgi:hypothetical protein